MDPMLSWVVFLFLGHHVGSFSCVISGRVLFINTHCSSSKDSSLFRLLGLNITLSIVLFWFYVVQRRSEININISIYDAKGVVFVFWRDFQDINLKFIVEDLYSDGVSFMETSEVSELIL